MPVFNMMQGGGNNSGSSDYGTLPLQISNLKARSNNETIILTWTNPNDSNFTGVLIKRASTGYPTKPSDGTQVYDGSLQTATDTGLINGTTYYYRAFAYNSNHEYQTSECYISAIPAPYHTYGVCIDTINANPETAVTYVEDAIGMTSGSIEWNNTPIYKNIKPCVFKNGVVQYYLNPNDLTKKVDGTASILTGLDGDVMIEIPKMGVKFVNDSVNRKQYIYVTNNPDETSSGFHYYAHTRATEGDKSNLYIGRYLGSLNDSKLCSYSGASPVNSLTISQMRTYAQAKGTGYDIVSYYPFVLLQALYLIKYKSLDSQSKIGRGFVSESNSTITQTGGTNTKGMDYGETTGTEQMSFLNIEDLWGNLRCYIDGFYHSSNNHNLTAFKDFNDTGLNYKDVGTSSVSNASFISLTQCTTDSGFLPINTFGSSTTYYSDYATLNANTNGMLVTGGYYKDSTKAGMFYFDCYVSSESQTYDNLAGARLMYL